MSSHESSAVLLPACPRCGHPGYRDALGRRYCGNPGCDHTDELPCAKGDPCELPCFSAVVGCPFTSAATGSE
jgi:hypothetical protein